MDSPANGTENGTKVTDSDVSIMIGDDTDALPSRGNYGTPGGSDGASRGDNGTPEGYDGAIPNNGESVNVALDAEQNSTSGSHASQQDDSPKVLGSASPLVMGTSLVCLLGSIFSLLAFFSVDVFGWEPPLSSIARFSICLNFLFVPLSWILYAFNRKTEQRKKLLVFALSILGLCAVWIGIVMFFIILGMLASM